MALPASTKEWAAEQVETLGPDLPRSIYEKGERFDYGLRGALEDGVWMRYPHELEENANCYEMAVHTYALADAADLDPRFFKARIGIDHGFVDVDWDGDRVIIDPFQNAYGPVERYDDQEIRLRENPVTGKTEVSYDTLTRIEEEALRAEIETLRDHPTRMLAARQRIGKTTEAWGRTYDQLTWDEDEHVLERTLDIYDDRGFLDDLVTQRWHFDRDGTVTDTELRYEAAENISWNGISGRRTITTVTRDGAVPHEHDPSLRAHCNGRAAYDAARGNDTRVYTEEELDRFWETYRDHLTPWGEPTGFVGGFRANRLSFLEGLREDEPERFYARLDWYRFLRDHDIEEAEPHTDRHDRGRDAARRRGNHHAIGTTIRGIGTELSERDGDDAVECIRRHGPASAYTALATAVRDGDDPGLVQHYPLIATHPDLREPLRHATISDTLPEVFQRLDDCFSRSSVEAPESLPALERGWSYDPEQRELRHRITLEDSLSYYTGHVETTYHFDALGNENGIETRIWEGQPDQEDGFLLYHGTGDPADITVPDIQDQAVERTGDLTEPRTLAAPHPAAERSFLDRNRAAAGLYSRIILDGEEPDPLFSDTAVEAFTDQFREEIEAKQDSPYRAPAERDDAEEMLDMLDEAVDREDWRIIAEVNHIESLARQGETQRIADAVTSQYDPGEQIAAYCKKYADPFEAVLWTDTYRREATAIRGVIRDGLQDSIPAHDDIERAETVPDHLKDASALLDRRQAWTRKGPQLQTLLDRSPRPRTAAHRRAAIDTLRSVEHRLQGRTGLKDWGGREALLDTTQNLRSSYQEVEPGTAVGTVTEDEAAQAIIDALQD